jgi:hypothetical protein
MLIIPVNELKNKLDALRKELSQQPLFCFTSDVDWASEYAVEQSLQYFRKFSIPVTFFLTHKSDVLDNAIQKGLVHAGIHPNFLPESSQGNSFDEVIDFCFNLLPNAVCFRSHRYFEVNDVYEKMYSRGIRYASNTCTFLENIPPFFHRSGLVQFPIFFEDGAYLWQGGELSFKSVKCIFSSNGLKVINIHPMHLMLNTPYFAYTRKIKDAVSKEEWNCFDEQAIKKMRSSEIGIADFINEMIEFIGRKNIKIVNLNDMYEKLIQ